MFVNPSFYIYIYIYILLGRTGVYIPFESGVCDMVITHLPTGKRILNNTKNKHDAWPMLQTAVTSLIEVSMKGVVGCGSRRLGKASCPVIVIILSRSDMGHCLSPIFAKCSRVLYTSLYPLFLSKCVLYNYNIYMYTHHMWLNVHVYIYNYVYI